MKLPYSYHLTVKTLLSGPELSALLARHALTGPAASAPNDALRQAAVASGADYLYRADLSPGGFKLFICRRQFDFKPDWRPVCGGTYHPYGTGCRLELTLKAVLFVRIFMSIWGFGALFGFSAIFFSSLAAGKYGDALPAPLVFSPFALGFWLFHKVIFKNDADTCLHFLRRIGAIGKLP